MDVLPTVAEEAVARYQLRIGASKENQGASSSPTATATQGSTGAVFASTQSTVASGAVTADVAKLLARLWLLGSSKTDAVGNVGEEPEKIESLVEDVVDYLLLRSTLPSLTSLLLTSKIDSVRANLLNGQRSAEVKHHAVGIRLVDTIAQKKNASAEEILGDITLYILHYYNQLDNTKSDYAAVERDTASVLCTVMPRAQAIAFTKQDAIEKQRQLGELAKVTWGIRIYYKEAGKAPGIGIIDVRAALERPLKDLGEHIADALERVSLRIRKTLAVLMAPASPLSNEERRLLGHEYHHMMQIKHVYLELATTHAALKHRIESILLSTFEQTFAELEELFVKSNANGVNQANTLSAQNIPKRVAYPKFVQLADSYSMSVRAREEFEELQEVLALAIGSESAYSSLLPESFAEEALEKASAQPSVARVALAQVATTMLSSRAPMEDYRGLYTPDSPHTLDTAVDTHYPQLLFGLHAFCPISYAKTGLLVEGKLNAEEDPTSPGYVVLEGGSGNYALNKPWYFAFADEPSLRAFVLDPLKYFLPCLKQCNRVEPGVTLLLGLEPFLPQELYVAGAREVDASSLSNLEGAKVDVATQTGQIDSYFDRNYRWNEWDLRRQALKLVNLMNMRTHSAQTAASHFRRENATQVDPPKEISTQTMSDAATQPPQVVQYLKGLRGTESSEIEQVQKTIQY